MVKRKYLFKTVLVLAIFILIPAMKRPMEQLPKGVPAATKVKKEIPTDKAFVPEEGSPQSIILAQDAWSKSKLLEHLVGPNPDPVLNKPIIIGEQFFKRLQNIVPFLRMYQQEIEQNIASLDADTLMALFVESYFFGISTLEDMVLKKLVSEKNLPSLIQKFLTGNLKNYRLSPALKKKLAKAIDLRCVANIFPAKKVKTERLNLGHLYNQVFWADTQEPTIVIRSMLDDVIVLRNEQATQIRESNVFTRNKKKSIMMPLQVEGDPLLFDIYDWNATNVFTPHSFALTWQGVQTPYYISNYDGTMLAVVAHNEDNAIKIFDTDGGVEVVLNAEQPIATSELEFSVDGKKVAIVSPDSLEIAIWDLENGLLKKQLTRDEDIVNVAWTNDNQRLIASTLNSLVIWDAQTYEKIHELKTTVNFSKLYVSPNGKFVAFRYPYFTNVGVWDIESGEQRLLLSVAEYSYDAYSTIAWHPEGTYLAIAAGDLVQIWDTQSWKLIRELPVLVGNTAHNPGVSGFDWSPDGRYLVVLDNDANLTTWELPQELSTDSLEQALLLRYFCSQMVAGEQIQLLDIDPAVLHLLKEFDPNLTSDEHIIAVYKKLPENIKSVLEPLITFM